MPKGASTSATALRFCLQFGQSHGVSGSRCIVNGYMFCCVCFLGFRRAPGPTCSHSPEREKGPRAVTVVREVVGARITSSAFFGSCCEAPARPAPESSDLDTASDRKPQPLQSASTKPGCQVEHGARGVSGGTELQKAREMGLTMPKLSYHHQLVARGRRGLCQLRPSRCCRCAGDYLCRAVVPGSLQGRGNPSWPPAREKGLPRQPARLENGHRVSGRQNRTVGP